MTEDDMRSVFFQTIILLALLSPGHANAEFTSQNCKKIYMAYTAMLVKYGMLEILGDDLNNDLHEATKQASETAGDTSAIEALQRKYQSRLQLVQADMKEINEGNVALKELCLKK
ncbi:hypothetical protein LP421_22615 [Rhizobium sp. RCAM05350]|nr:hypothetical protein LP421_22615 [Rhizobium sp. RCAM05350]